MGNNEIEYVDEDLRGIIVETWGGLQPSHGDFLICLEREDGKFYVYDTSVDMECGGNVVDGGYPPSHDGLISVSNDIQSAYEFGDEYWNSCWGWGV